MTDCWVHIDEAKSAAEKRAVSIALVLNAAMFVIGTAAGLLAQSTALLSDALDMLADASAYALALLAVSRSALFKRRVASTSAVILGVLGASVIVEAVRRFLSGSEPDGAIMLSVAVLSLVVNAMVLRLLAPHRRGDVHLRASWIFTRADVVANMGVILAALMVIWTGSRYPDLVIGLAIGSYVVKEAFEIRNETRAAERVRLDGKS